MSDAQLTFTHNKKKQIKCLLTTNNLIKINSQFSVIFDRRPFFFFLEIIFLSRFPHQIDDPIYLSTRKRKLLNLIKVMI